MAYIVLAGVKIPVAIVEGIELDDDDDENVRGSYDVVRGIRIRSGMYSGEQETTLLHETLHASFPGMDEDAVVNAERFIMSLIHENGGNTAWLGAIVNEAKADAEMQQYAEGQ